MTKKSYGTGSHWIEGQAEFPRIDNVFCQPLLMTWQAPDASQSFPLLWWSPGCSAWIPPSYYPGLMLHHLLFLPHCLSQENKHYGTGLQCKTCVLHRLCPIIGPAFLAFISISAKWAKAAMQVKTKPQHIIQIEISASYAASNSSTEFITSDIYCSWGYPW